MEKQELNQKILGFVSAIYKKPLEELSLETNIKKDLGGTSLFMVGLVSLIENELDVLLPLPTAAGCKTIGDLVDSVEKLM